MSDLERAEHTWDTIDINAVRSVAWSSLEQVSRDVSRRFSGGLGVTHATAELLARFRPGDQLVGAAVICGDMQSERGWFERTPFVTFKRVEGFDLSQASLDRYIPDGVEWVPTRCDCNSLVLVPNSYDLVVASHGAHHIRELDNLFAQAHAGLREDGLLSMYEWIGPTFLQIPRRNKFFARLLLLTLFPRPGARTTHMGKRKGLGYIQDPPNEFDPSEACNSLALYPAFVKYFEPLVEYRHGGITYPMFEGLAQNMHQRNRWTRCRIGLVVALDRILTRFRLIHPLFVLTIGQRRVEI